MYKSFDFPNKIREIKRIPHELVLVDTCVVLGQTEWFELTSYNSSIKSTGMIPTITDFTVKEIRNAGGREYKRIVDRVRDRRNGEHFLAFLKTPFKTLKECKSALDTLPNGLKHEILKAFREEEGLNERSRHKDFALISTGSLLSINGIDVGIASLDRCIRKACHALSSLNLGLGFYGLKEVYKNI